MVSGRQNQSPPPFRQTFWPDKWGLRERYGEPNLDEKEFQLFQLFIDRFWAFARTGPGGFFLAPC